MVSERDKSPEDMGSQRDKPKTEVRLALVLNGGVSLAVWMGGVAHELDLLRRASRSGDSAEGLRQQDKPVFEFWRDLSCKTNNRVLVDIVAGTSAGGLNGMLLATAIGRGTALPYLRETWVRSADLDELLKPSTPQQNSLLNGVFFEEEVRKTLNEIEEKPAKKEPVILFMTATALDGRCRSFKDASGGQFDVRDHRRLYRFESDKEAVVYKLSGDRWDIKPAPRDDFARAKTNVLARAARASASYPAAFAPVNEELLVEGGYREHPKPSFNYPASCVMDGGILNNAPFGPVLEAIAERRLDAPVRRIVVYVVPSAGRDEEYPTDRPCKEVPFTTAAWNAIQYPQEADFRSSTDILSATLRNSTRDAQQELFREVFNELGMLPRQKGAMESAAEGIFSHYRDNRAVAATWLARSRLAEVEAVTSLVAAPRVDAKRVLAKNPVWIPKDQSDLHPNLDDWSWGIITAERLLQVLRNDIHDFLKHESDEQKQEALRRATREISYKLRNVLAIKDAITLQLSECRPSRSDLTDEEVAEHLNSVMEKLKTRQKVGAYIREASVEYAETMAGVGAHNPRRSADDAITAYLIVEVLIQAFSPAARMIEPLTPRFEFLRLAPNASSPLFHRDQFAGLGDRKLYGIRLRHFGAFVNPEWRRSDFTWGRLDAAHHLLRLFIKGDEERQQQEIELHKRILAAEARVQPGKSPLESGRQQMTSNLIDLSRSDRRLIKNLLDTQQGKAQLQQVILRLLELAGASADSARTENLNKAGRFLVKWIKRARPLIVRNDSALSRSERNSLARRMTNKVRAAAWNAFYNDPRKVPASVIGAVQARFVLGIFTVVLVWRLFRRRAKKC
ncbi:DUF3376 domain-containing protein [Nonomuraea basaltis]|uniref:DUF3376 domain-containing protein n=1 Tax=Nonomuraea basaltis TaxID=2495887 RepID=UPI00110C6060|nr:DUF3376 domain-containing protein [Nonomuraea basaltis]TMR93027.1 DUF3376 domain-containing protein [Nonomuraea basaltis]